MKQVGLLVAGIFLIAACMLRAESASDVNYIPEMARRFADEGNKAFADGRYDDAKAAYQKVLELAPGNLLGLINLGSVYYRLGETGNAEKVLLQAVRARLETAPAWMTLGLVYLDADKLDEALAAFSQAAIYDSRNPRIHNYLGVTIGRKGWRDGAEAELRRALEIDPGYGEAHFNLSVFYLERKPPAVELARRHYKRAKELGAESDPALERQLSPPETPPATEER